MQADLVALARGWLGTPYHHQASLKGVGCDCLGLIRGVYAEACGRPTETPPPYSRDWAEAAARETMIEAAGRHLTRIDPAAAEPGDVLIFRLRPGAMAKHCGIMTCAPGIRPTLGPLPGPEESAPFRIIHAIEGAPACEVHLTPWWRRRIAAAFRFPDQENPHAEPVQQASGGLSSPASRIIPVTPDDDKRPGSIAGALFPLTAQLLPRSGKA